MAANWLVRPSAILGFAAVTPIDTSVAGETVKTVDAVVPPNAALMVTAPGLSAVACPS